MAIFPKEFNSEPSDTPELADFYEFSVQHGDILVLASDGILDNIEDSVTIKSDTSFYKYLLPNLSQISNFFYSKNVIELKDNVLDVFELNEREIEIYY